MGFLGPARGALRTSVVDACRRLLTTDDGRRLMADGLSGLTRSAPAPGPLVDATSIYPELPCGRRTAPRTRPVFITARFRSGSTLLWNIFRNVPECTAFYEPLNERRWFDPSRRGTRIDGTHLGVAEYWEEYAGLEHLGRWYRDEWTSRRLFMSAEDWDGDLVRYIDGLIAAAPHRAVLQFNRIDFRLGWIRHYYPDAILLHLFRHPRDQWCSTLGDASAVPLNATVEQFAPQDGYYLLAWSKDLCYHFPFLDPRSAAHPYELFYYLWRLSHLFGVSYADQSIAFERLHASTDTVIPGIMSTAGISHYSLQELTGLLDPRAGVSRWSSYGSHEWFCEIEGRCEATLARWARG